MRREMLIEAGIGEIRMALMEDDRPVELNLYREAEGPFPGEELSGRVTKIMPETDAAFVETTDGIALLPFRRAKKLPTKTGRPPRGISDCVTEGEAVMVRIMREAEPVDGKAAVCHLVARGEAKKPTVDFAGRIVALALARAARYGVERIVIDGAEAFRTASGIASDIQFDQWTNTTPLFADPGAETTVEDAIEEALMTRVPLQSGGSIRIDETAALTAIDVDTGSANSAGGAEAVRLRTNIEAAEKIAWALRFLGIGGLIVIDSIDMKRKKDRAALIDALDRALQADPTPSEHTDISRFGLVELSRARAGPSIRQKLLGQRAQNTSVEAAAYALLRLAERTGKEPGPGDLVLAGSTPVLAWLERRPALTGRLAQRTRRRIVTEASDNDMSAHISAAGSGQ